MIKRLLTYGLLLLTILASHFVVSACQDDLPETTEVMMTFTTRASITGMEGSTASDEERMKDLRVIMIRNNDGTVVDNHYAGDINASSVSFMFETPVSSGGEWFTFMAIANENTLSLHDELNAIGTTSAMNEAARNQWKEKVVGSNEAFALTEGQAIPQTKMWTSFISPSGERDLGNQPLDFLVSKISVTIVNTTRNPQTLTGLNISGINPKGKGRLFKDDNTEVFVIDDNTNPDLSQDITFADQVTIASGESVTYYYYTYPVTNITNPSLNATWNGNQKSLALSTNEQPLTALERGKHLQIGVSLIGTEMLATYTIADWKLNDTNIGSPVIGDGYGLHDWGNGDDVVIGGDDSGGSGDDDDDTGGGSFVPEGNEVFTYTEAISMTSDWISLGSLVPSDKIKPGNSIVFYFTCRSYGSTDFTVEVRSGWNNDIGDEPTLYECDKDEQNQTNYVKYITFEEVMNGINIDGPNGLQTQNLSLAVTKGGEGAVHATIYKMAIVEPY